MQQNLRWQTEMTMVMANCLYSCPVVPGRKAAGMKTAARTKTTAITGPVTSSIALMAASLAVSSPIQPYSFRRFRRRRWRHRRPCRWPIRCRIR